MNWLDIFSTLNDPDDRSPDEAGQRFPMYARISQAIESAIGSGLVTDDTRLPTNRELASLLKLDRSTIARAYLELSQKGLIESHVGRGTYVRPRRSRHVSGAVSSGKLGASSISIDWQDKFSQASETLADILSRQPAAKRLTPDVISFAGGIPTDEFYPSSEFQRIVKELIASPSAVDMFGYSPADGLPALREEVKAQLLNQGIAAADDELLVVSGSQQGIDLVSNAFIDAGDVVLLEEPTYFWALSNFKARQARCLPVPMDEEGMRLDVLESILARHKSKLLYLMPSFQNPTGSTLSISRRRKLIDLARYYQLAILEDNFVGDLTYEGEPLKPLRALPGAADLVIHQGTFSKALCPGLRLGWLVAPAVVTARLTAAKRASDLSTNSIAQVILAKYLKEGLYAEHLERVRAAYRRRRDTMLGALTRHFSRAERAWQGQLGKNSVSWLKPNGGLFIWLSLPAGFSTRDLLAYAEREGVTFSPGDLFFINGDQSQFMRLCFIQTEETAIEAGIERLARACDKYFEDTIRSSPQSRSSSERATRNVLI